MNFSVIFFYYDDLISPNFQLSPEEADSRLHDLVSSTKDGNSLTSEKVASVTNDLENLAIFANDNEAVGVDQSYNTLVVFEFLKW